MNITPQQVYEYASEHGPYPEGEHIIATDSAFSTLYAMDILNGAFTLGEPIIATDPMWGYLYAKYVIKSRFIQFEQYSKTHHSGKYQPFASLYCENFNIPKSILGIY